MEYFQQLEAGRLWNRHWHDFLLVVPRFTLNFADSRDRGTLNGLVVLRTHEKPYTLVHRLEFEFSRSECHFIRDIPEADFCTWAGSNGVFVPCFESTTLGNLHARRDFASWNFCKPQMDQITQTFHQCQRTFFKADTLCGACVALR